MGENEQAVAATAAAVSGAAAGAVSQGTQEAQLLCADADPGASPGTQWCRVGSNSSTSTITNSNSGGTRWRGRRGRRQGREGGRAGSEGRQGQGQGQVQVWCRAGSSASIRGCSQSQRLKWPLRRLAGGTAFVAPPSHGATPDEARVSCMGASSRVPRTAGNKKESPRKTKRAPGTNIRELKCEGEHFATRGAL